MRITTPVRLVVSLLGGVLALAAFQSDSEKPKAQDKANASVEGKISHAITGEPIKKVTVTINGHGKNLTAETDDKGVFLFLDLEPGRYTLSAQKTGFAPGFYGARGNSLAGAPVELAAGQQMKEANWKLAPNAVISGKVLDEDGEAVQNAMVMPMVETWNNGKKLYAPMGQAISNDQGEYRVSGLKSGRYIVMASNLINNMTGGLTGAAKPATAKPEPAFITTYYPNVADQSAAAPVDVQTGGEVGRIDIRLIKVDSFRVKGRWDNAPTQGKMTMVVLTPKGSGILGMLSANRAMLNADGTFELRGVPPGEYLLTATQDFLSPMGAQIPVQVKDQHISGIVMQTVAPVDLSGSVAVEGKDHEKAAMSRYTVRLEPVDSIMLNPPKATPDDSGKFTMKGVTPGKYRLRASGTGYAKTLKYGDREVDDDGIDLSAGVAGPLQVVFDTEVADVRGSVADDDGVPMTGVTVVLVPDSRRLAQFHDTISDPKGQFHFADLPPGDYKLLAWEEMQPNQFQDPQFLTKYIAKAETVVLKANDKKSYSLKAIPARK